MASAYTTFYCFPLDLLSGLHDLDVDVFHIALTDTAPVAATDNEYPDLSVITPGNGYTAGGELITLSPSLVGDDAFVFGSSVVVTAIGGSIGPFRYAVLFNYSAPTQPLIGYWDRGSSLTLLDTESVTLVPDAVNGAFKVTI